MTLKYNKIYILIFLVLYDLNLSEAVNCSGEPMMINEHFAGCCPGRPKYYSIPCMDKLRANGTFSSECYLNCMYRDNGFYDGSTIDMLALKHFLDSQITDDTFKLVYMKGFARCKKLDKNSIKEKFEFITMENKLNCDIYPQQINICVWYYILANCPSSYAADDEYCYIKREWANECLLKS
ncbi:uncharacterized protein ACRADG_010517 [Cochliomyia hominivorax]